MSIDIKAGDWMKMQSDIVKEASVKTYSGSVNDYLGCTHEWLGLYSNGTRRVRFTFNDPNDELYYRLKWNNIC